MGNYDLINQNLKKFWDYVHAEKAELFTQVLMAKVSYLYLFIHLR